MTANANLKDFSGYFWAEDVHSRYIFCSGAYLPINLKILSEIKVQLKKYLFSSVFDKGGTQLWDWSQKQGYVQTSTSELKALQRMRL